MPISYRTRLLYKNDMSVERIACAKYNLYYIDMYSYLVVVSKLRGETRRFFFEAKVLSRNAR